MLSGLLIGLRVLEAGGITLASGLILKGIRDWQSLSLMFLGILVTLILLDLFAPEVGLATRQGVGINTGRTMVGGNYMGLHTALDTQDKVMTGGNYMGLHTALDTRDKLMTGGNYMGLHTAIDTQKKLQVTNSMVGGKKTRPQVDNEIMIATQLDTETLDRAIDELRAMDKHNYLAEYDGNIHQTFESQITEQDHEVKPNVPNELSNKEQANFKNCKPLSYVEGKFPLVSGQPVELQVNSPKGTKIWTLLEGKHLITLENPGTGNLLHRLRLKLISHDDLKVKKLRYGDTVNLVYSDEMGHDVMINVDLNQRLNVLKTIKNESFTIDDTSNSSKKGTPVCNGDDIVLKSNNTVFHVKVISKSSY